MSLSVCLIFSLYRCADVLLASNLPAEITQPLGVGSQGRHRFGTDGTTMIQINYAWDQVG
jgi:hypothetical protein